MAYKYKPARDVARHRGNNHVWLDHAVVSDSDYDWLATVERLTLWNVRLPMGFLSKLTCLRWLDLRGGSAKDIGVVEGAERLRFLSINQVRGACDLTMLSHLHTLQLLKLYGLPKVESFPSLARLSDLERIEIGQMRGLNSISGLLEAPRLRELLLLRKINITPSDIDKIVRHSSLEQFDWFAEDVPDKIWQPVIERVGLPKITTYDTDEWFEKKGG
jgi:hypothetical protein